MLIRLRAMQERAQDRQSAIDELRAKRYQEQKDRQWRMQQMEQAAKRDGMKSEIAQARDMQRSEKSRRMAEQALQEREEYLRVLDWQKTQTEIDEKRIEEAEAAKTHHREHLLVTIVAPYQSTKLVVVIIIMNGLVLCDNSPKCVSMHQQRLKHVPSSWLKVKRFHVNLKLINANYSALNNQK
jgi:hypothetical protein